MDGGAEVQKLVEDMPVVVMELVLHGAQLLLRQPLGMRRVVAAAHLGQGFLPQVEEVRLGDYAPAPYAIPLKRPCPALGAELASLQQPGHYG